MEEATVVCAFKFELGTKAIAAYNAINAAFGQVATVKGKRVTVRASAAVMTEASKIVKTMGGKKKEPGPGPT